MLDRILRVLLEGSDEVWADTGRRPNGRSRTGRWAAHAACGNRRDTPDDRIELALTKAASVADQRGGRRRPSLINEGGEAREVSSSDDGFVVFLAGPLHVGVVHWLS